MIFTWHIFIQSVIIVSFWTISYSYTSSPSDWKEVEKLAEDHPYVVAILDIRREYICTGFSITDKTVVTAGSCLATIPYFVTISAALGDDVVGKNLLHVSHFKVHSAFSCYISKTQPSETIMNSNIALIYVSDNKLDYFTNVADIGDFGPLQLRKQKLAVVGFGELNLGSTVLQRQVYVQRTCVNPQWFYCVCGIESPSETTYENQFGEGAPVVLNGKVVAMAAAPCGELTIPNKNIKFNIFTVVMQYHSWIRANRDNVTTKFQFKLESHPNNCICCSEVVVKFIVTMLIIVNLIN